MTTADVERCPVCGVGAAGERTFRCEACGHVAWARLHAALRWIVGRDPSTIPWREDPLDDAARERAAGVADALDADGLEAVVRAVEPGAVHPIGLAERCAAYELLFRRRDATRPVIRERALDPDHFDGPAIRTFARIALLGEHRETIVADLIARAETMEYADYEYCLPELVELARATPPLLATLEARAPGLW